jgi:hypothetical protein
MRFGMPGQRRTVGPRTRGSRVPILIGLGAIVVLAGAGTAAYLVAFHPARPVHPVSLPQKVLGVQTVGLIGEVPPSVSASGLVQLLSPQTAPGFTAVQPSEAVSGTPEWTADQMAGGTYIFIYLPTGQCLASRGPASAPGLALQHCDLSSLDQRWQRLGTAIVTSGHDFYEWENAGAGKCISQVTATAGHPGGAALAPCNPARPATELLAFWWSAN